MDQPAPADRLLVAVVVVVVGVAEKRDKNPSPLRLRRPDCSADGSNAGILIALSSKIKHYYNRIFLKINF